MFQEGEAMRSILRVVILLITAGVLTVPGQAQRQATALRSLASSDLVLNPVVQKELQLTAEQITQVTKAISDLQARERLDLDFLPQRRKGEPSQAYQDLKKQLEKDRQKALAAILRPEQMKRFEQIEVQQRGLADPKTQETLKLTAEQKETIKRIDTRLQQDVRDLLKGRPGKDALDKAQKVAKDAREKAVAVLTDDQRKTWKEMTGEPIDVPPTPQGQVVPLPRIDLKDIEKKKDPNIPDIYRTKPKKIDI
jgi:hypothetical protein